MARRQGEEALLGNQAGPQYWPAPLFGQPFATLSGWKKDQGDENINGNSAKQWEWMERNECLFA